MKDISIKDGNITLDIKNDNNINFKALIKGLNLPIQKDGQNIENLDILGNINSLQTIGNVQSELYDFLKEIKFD